MKILIKATLILLMLSFSGLYASDTHKHNSLTTGISNSEIKKVAVEEVRRLALNKKIPKSWKSVPISKIGRTHYGDNDDWIVIFNNPKVKKKSRRNLYIFVSKQGIIRGTNYTGM